MYYPWALTQLKQNIQLTKTHIFQIIKHNKKF